MYAIRTIPRKTEVCKTLGVTVYITAGGGKEKI